MDATQKKSVNAVGSLNLMNSIAAVTEGVSKAIDTTELGSKAVKNLKKAIDRNKTAVP